MSTSSRRIQRPEIWLLIGVFAISVVFAVWALAGGWGNPILDRYGFRQAQTALSVRYLLEGGPLLAYETPVVGAPWSIPFEFPLYQWAVAIVANTVSLGIDQAGRAVSIAAYLASVFPIWYLLGKVGISRPLRLAFLSLYFVSPIYVFWSRTVMIESLALFLGLAYLALVLRYLEGRSIVMLIAASVAGVLSGIVKVTTFVPFCLLVIGALGMDAWRRRAPSIDRPLLTSLVPGILAAVALPVVATLAWTRFADHTKAQNVIGSFLTSSALRTWNTGSLEQRLDIGVWGTLGDRMWLIGAGSVVLLAALVAVIVTNRYRAEFVVSVGVGLTTFLIFTNLHYVHDYYQYAIGLFFLAAVGFGIAALVEQTSSVRWAGYGLLAIAVLVSMFTYTTHYRPKVDTASHHFATLSTEIMARTAEDEVLVVFGADWTSEIAYVANRRALTLPTGLTQPDLVAKAVNDLEGYRVGAMVVCFEAIDSPLVLDWAAIVGANPSAISTVDGCAIHMVDPG